MGSQAVNNPVEDVLSDTPELAPPTPRPSGGERFPNPDVLQRQGPLVDLTPPPGYTGSAPIAMPQQASGQGPLAAIGSFLTARPTPQGQPSPYGIPNIPSAPLGMAMPPAASLLGRSALQGGAAGVEALQAGKGPLDIAKEAGKGAAFNVGAEKVLGPLARFIGRQSSAKGATKAYDAAVATREGKIAHDTAMTGAVNTTEQSAFKTAAGAHADDAAKKIAQDLIDKVPALKGTEVSGKGLYDAIYGSGKGKVSTAFDTAFKDVVEKGKGQVVQVPEEVASKLGLTNAGAGVAGLPANIQALFNKGAQKAGITPPTGTQGMLGVDAAELASKITGKFATDPRSYRAAMTALDEAGIGDPAARAAYKAYSGYSDLIDKAKGIDANGVLNPSNILKALADIKKVDILRRRGLGSGTEGAIQEAARGGPLKPTPREVPTPSPEISAPDIKTMKNPFGGHPWIGGMAGGAAGHALGLGNLGHVLGFGAGAGLSNALPREIVTKGPLSAGAQKAATNLPDIAGILARLLSNKVTST